MDAFTGDGTERDVIATGNDTIHAVDGIAESVSCDIGADIAEADTVDTVDASCETVKRSGAVVPPPPPPCTTCDAKIVDVNGDGKADITKLRALAVKLKTALKSGVKLQVPCTATS